MYLAVPRLFELDFCSQSKCFQPESYPFFFLIVFVSQFAEKKNNYIDITVYKYLCI